MTLYTKQGTRYKPTTLSEQGAWGWEDLMVIAAPPTAQAEGWRLVPVEPTEEMLAAAHEGDKEYTLRNFGDVVTVMQGPHDHWAAMIAAVPAPPTSAEGVEHG